MYKGYEARDQNGALRTLTCEREGMSLPWYCRTYRRRDHREICRHGYPNGVADRVNAHIYRDYNLSHSSENSPETVSKE